MATTYFSLFTRPYNDIGVTNFVKVVLYPANDPLAEYDSKVSEDPGPVDAKTWAFPGIITQNYICKIFEVDGDDNVVRQIEGEFTFIPSSSSFRYKEPIFIQIGVTPIPGDEDNLFPANVNTVNVPDWIGWTPIIEKLGIGTQKPSSDYTFDEETGDWDLLAVGDVFENNSYYFVQFRPIITLDEAVPNESAFLFSQSMVVTADTTLVAADIGKKILVKGATAYVEITLPDITTVIENRIAYFEFCKSTLKCCKILTHSGDVIEWFYTDQSAVYGCPGETIQLFKEVVDESTSVWRVHHSDGNFREVGQRIGEDQIAANVLNKVALDGGGTLGISSTEYARLYNEYVLRLPGAQVVSYASWATGTNKYLYSLKDPSTGKFHVPDLRNMFRRISDGIRTAGNFQDHAMMQHYHEVKRGDAYDGDNQESYGRAGGGQETNPQTDIISSAMTDVSGNLLTNNISTETRPVNVSENVYVVV